jgi:hypothetical protein
MPDLNHQFDELMQIISLSKIQNFTKGITVNKLHREIRIATTIATQLIGGNGIRVLQHGGHSCLTDKPHLFDLISGELRLKRFVANKTG